MVEDSQIKAEVSPFAIRKGEIKTFDGQDGYVSMNQIVHNASERFAMLRGIYWHHYPKVQIFHDHTPCKDSAKMSDAAKNMQRSL